MIIDLSEWQNPGAIDYDVFATQLEGSIVRVQYGKDYEDWAYPMHLAELQARGVPCAVYAWVRGGNLEEMVEEARSFYARAAKYNPVYWWLDIEEFSMEDMRAGCEVYRRTLTDCGAKRVGAYIANHLYAQLNLLTEAFDAIWLPTYGRNSGLFEGQVPTATTNYQMHQYTSNARISGYLEALDANRLNGVTLETLFPNDQEKVGELPKTTEEKKGKLPMKSFELDTAVYLQSGPSIHQPTIALLSKDSVVFIQDIVINEGYLWGEQLRADGSKGYIAMGELHSYGNLLE